MAPFTPAHVATVRSTYQGSPSLQKQRQDERKTTMNKVKRLYLDRRYKQCATLCDEVLKNDTCIHPLHETFLHFFAAICYESLGLTAHNFSSNKVPFLNLAKDAFAMASATLPLPYSSNENGVYDSPAISPALTDGTSNYAADTIVATTPAEGSPTPTPTFTISRRSSAASSDCSEIDTRPSSYSVPNFDDYSPRQSMTNAECFRDGLAPPDLKVKHGVNLSLNLDTPERASGLVPKPLFIKKKSPTVEAPSPPPPRPLPLPPIPPRNPHRQTALHLTPRIAHLTPSPSPSPATTTPISLHASLHAYLSSRSLARYNTHLASFRTQLSTHAAAVDEAIAQTLLLQKEHKARQSKRLASYWSFKPASSNDEDEDRTKAEKKARIERLRENGWRVNKERHGWKGEVYYADLRRKAEVELEA